LTNSKIDFTKFILLKFNCDHGQKFQFAHGQFASNYYQFIMLFKANLKVTLPSWFWPILRPFWIQKY